jgi:hypothetical protein
MQYYWYMFRDKERTKLLYSHQSQHTERGQKYNVYIFRDVDRICSY